MDGQSEVGELVRAIPAFASADAGVFAKLESIATIMFYPQGTMLFHEGDQHDHLYFVASGTITLEMVTEQCGTKPILTLGAGDLMAWSSLLGDGRMTASALVSEDSRLIAFPSADLRALCERDHDVGYVVMSGVARLMSRRLLATRLQLLDVFQA